MLGKRLVFIRQFLSEFNVKFDKGFIILIDHSAALDVQLVAGINPFPAPVILRMTSVLRGPRIEIFRE